MTYTISAPHGVTAPVWAPDVEDVVAASKAMVGVVARSMSDVLDDTVTLPQFRALVALRRDGSRRVGDLAAALDVQYSGVTRLTDRLVSAGLVQRRHNPKDRREVFLDLTDAGRQLVDSVLDRRREDLQTILLSIPAGDRERVAEALRILADAAEVQSRTAFMLGW